MVTDTRRQAIIHRLQEQDIVSVNQLIDDVDGSPATIRRDLRFLEENGVILRSHGYAKLIQPKIVSNIPITNMQIAVAQKAAAMIPDNTTILLDSGVSAVALAQELINRKNLTIITNSISVANALRDGEPTVYLTGGQMEGAQEALVGLDAENYIRNIHVPYLFLTTTGIRIYEGLVCVTSAQASLKHCMIQSADHVIVLADSEKMNTDSVRLFATFQEVDAIITDAPVNNSRYLSDLKNKHVELIVA